MNPIKKVGIWMDHATAHVIEFTTDPIQTNIIASKFTHQEREHSINKNEHLMHNQEKRMHTEYYKKLADTIRNYGEVLLFGPTDAKDELYNLIKEDHRFERIKIEVKPSERMTENQEHAFVRDHFSN